MKAAAVVSTKQPLVAATAASRAVGSKCRFLTTKTPQKPPTPASPSKSAPKESTAASSKNNTQDNGDMSNPPEVTLEVTPQMRMANVGLALVLCGFVGGVFYYSMSSVGSQEQGGNDPLAQLKLEAQEAMDRQEKDNTPDERAQQLLQEFNRGEHDPDKAEVDALEELEQMEQEDASKKKKKAWYKFW